MKLVQINVNDRIGERFNGLAVRDELKAVGVDSTHLVWNRTVMEPHVQPLLPYPGMRAFNRLANDLEDRWSLKSMLQVQSYALAAQKEFRAADIAHYHIIQDGFFSLRALPMLTGLKPSVWTWHDPWPMTGHCLHPKTCPGWRTGCGDCPDLERIFPMREDKTALNFRLKKDIYDRSKMDVIVASQWMADMAAASPIAEALKVHLVPFGLDLDLYTPATKALARAKLGIAPARTVIALRAQTSPFKGLDDLKTAIDQLKTDVPITLLTVQETGHFDHFLGGRHQVIDMAYVAGNAEMGELLSAADLYVMPSTADAFGLMAVEAMACGVPVIVYEGTALPWVVRAPEIGIATPMGDIPALQGAIERLVADPDERAARGRAARDLVEREYTVRLHVERLRAVYDDVLARRGQGAKTAAKAGRRNVKILLFTDLPPCENYPGGLVLNDLTRFLPPGDVVVFAAINHHLPVELSSNMEWMTAYLIDKPQEQGLRRTAPYTIFPDQIGAFQEWRRRRTIGPEILKKAVDFGREHQVDAILAVLQGQTIINLTGPLADALGVPLYTLVWDPLVWWIKDGAIDPWTAKITQKAFDDAVSRSQAVATASWAMAQAYQAQYGVRAVPIIRSHEAVYARHPVPKLTAEGELVIGFAGQAYADAVRFLIAMLNKVDWTIQGRAVRIRAFGHHFPDQDIPEGRLESMGWHAEEALIDGLATCDILYCPYPFDLGIEEVSRLSFPSKLVAYLAAGRPVVLHGPADSSPSIYVRDKDVGLCATGKHASSIFNALDRLASEPAVYEKLAMNAQAAFQSDFTRKRMRESFLEFLGLSESEAPAWTETAKVGALRDEREWKVGEQIAIPKPNLVLRLLHSLATDRQELKHVMTTLLCPIRQRLDLQTGWEAKKNDQGISPEAGYVELSTGLQGWDYLGVLRLNPRRASARYLSANITLLGENAYALLVDKDWNMVGERLDIPQDLWWRRIWFDLAKTPTAHFLVFQANVSPTRRALKVHQAILYSPLSTLLGRLFGKRPA